MSSFTGSQNPSSLHPIRQETAPTHYSLSSSFVPSHQRTMPSQQTSNISIAVGDFQSQVSRTPRPSHVTTPESIFSAPQRPGSARNGPRGVDTPASTLSIGYRASMPKGTMSPAQMFPTQDRVSSSLDESSFNHNWVSELNGDDQDWLHNNDIHHAQLQTHHNLDTQEQRSNQNAIHSQAVNHGTGLRSSSQDSTSVPGQVSSGSTTNTGDDWDPVLGFQDFPIPPSFEDLNDEIFERKDGSFQTNNQNAHPYQPSTSAYAQPFDFDTAHVNDSAYGSGYANTPPTLPSNAFDLGHDSKNGAGGRGRQGIHDANKDALLVQMRGEGKSYKEIMATKIFGLQESTLRGRYRTLTKNKEQRVRKPAWSQAAVAALVEGVEALAPPSAKRPRTKDALDKVPWKKVAEWMRDNKGCYHYGNATVKKKYQELLKEEQQRATQEIRKSLY